MNLSTQQEFQVRHIGPDDTAVSQMLAELKLKNLEDLAAKVIPQNILSQHSFAGLGGGISEYELLKLLKSWMSENQVKKNYIGMGFHDTITPTVILRNVFESPAWYTAYTPYQAEISQGRMESLLNFQTMVTDLTGMEISNASLLDEGTAAAEAVAMAHGVSRSKLNMFIAAPDLHPHVLEVMKTRAQSAGLEMRITDPVAALKDPSIKPFAVVVSYPTTEGYIRNYSDLASQAHAVGALVIADVDLLSLALLKPPGEWGADIVVGNSQRFGVPLGNGGPHAAFLATKDAFKRSLPGRLIGVSVDSHGNPALRLALQTREQHIRREKATSNICTAQVLLANMAAMYAVYHGPGGVKQIAKRIHIYAQSLRAGLKSLGLEVSAAESFDAVVVLSDKASELVSQAEKQGMNLRSLGPKSFAISLSENTNETDLAQLAQVLAGKSITIDQVKGWIQNVGEGKKGIPEGLQRTSNFMTHPIFNRHHSETSLMRYIYGLQSKDLTLAQSMIPLGSCTMKCNAATELAPVSWDEVSQIHPFAPLSQSKGYLKLFEDLDRLLCEITGFAAVSLQPNAGSQGEYAGLLVIQKYHERRGEKQRKICLIPSSAHGTNPASAVMAGMEVVVVACDSNGNVDIGDLKIKAQKYQSTLAALMITYPSTHGVFEEGVREICSIVHECGGQVYMDGANLNALVGVCRPGEFGPDVSHMNLHKTFSIPHGGGGPGVGPIGVAKHLAPFLPKHALVPASGPAQGVGTTTSAPWGSASILPISWAYIKMMGAEGLKRATLISILNANYIAKKLAPYYPILYTGKSGFVAHECILDLRTIKEKSGIDVTDVAKRLMDYGFHAPTMSWPVPGTLMVEPTESEDKAEIDRFIHAMISIREEIAKVESGKWTLEDNPLVKAPHTAAELTATDWKHGYSREVAAFPVEWVRVNKFWPAVGRVDNAYGDRNIMCSCPPMEDYAATP